MAAVSINGLKDVYFHVPMAPEHTKYTCFAYNGRAYKFQVLPFGQCTAPLVFMRVVRLIETFLKVHGVCMHQYLDDFMVASQ